MAGGSAGGQFGVMDQHGELNEIQVEESSSDEESSDWDDWRDPEYIEEQR